MDIDEYLRKKKDLEKKKEILEAKQDLEKKKLQAPKKELKITHKREITPLEDEPHDGRHYRRSHSNGGENIKWAILGMAFFVALLILGFFYMTNYMMQSSNSDDSKDVEKLQEKIDALEKSLVDVTNESADGPTETIDETNETDDEIIETTGPGPDIEIYLMDDRDDITSLGIFDSSGKVGGKLVQLYAENLDDALYEYRLFIKNMENANIQCTVDELIEIDDNNDGKVDDTKYDNKLAVLELEEQEEEVMFRSYKGFGYIKGEYEATCYFCADQYCDEIFTDGETKSTAKYKVTIEQKSFEDNNLTNSS